LLRRSAAEQNTATIIATHSTEAAALANVLVRLRDGRIQEIERR
jgi:ABC-type lipoprotein export system ATPase subunit